MNNNLKKVLEFLDSAQTYYLATMDNDQPRVRPFGGNDANRQTAEGNAEGYYLCSV